MLFFSPSLSCQLQKRTLSSDRSLDAFAPPLSQDLQQGRQLYSFSQQHLHTSSSSSPLPSPSCIHQRRHCSNRPFLLKILSRLKTRTRTRAGTFRQPPLLIPRPYSLNSPSVIHLTTPSSFSFSIPPSDSTPILPPLPSFSFTSSSSSPSSSPQNTIPPVVVSLSNSTRQQRQPRLLPHLPALSALPTTKRRLEKRKKAKSTYTTKTRVLATFLVMAASSLSSLTHAQLSLGCFGSGTSSTSNLPTLPGLTPPYRDIYMSQGACSNYCKTSQYMYAVVEGGTACYCSNQQPPDANRVEDSKCDKPCAGYPFEMCGSVPDSAGSSGVGAGAYANVMLVGNSLVAENAPAPPPPPPVPVPPPASIPADSSTSVESEKKPTPAAATAAAAKGSLHPEARNDSKSAKSKVNDEENTDEGGNDEEDNNDDESTEGDDDSGDQAGGDGEGEDEDGDDEDGKDESQLGNSGKALSGHGKKSSASNGSKIPVASISVAVACLFGICAFLIYLTKKRKRERVRAAWVESVFGANGSSTQGGPSPGPYNNSTMNSAMTERMMSAASHPGGAGGGRGAGYHQRNLYDDRNSMMSDSPDRDRMIDRRQSTASTVAGVAATPMSAGGGGIGTRRESAMSRNIHNTVMLPSPAVRGSYGTTAVTPSWGGGGYSSHRNPEPHHSDGYQNHHHNERYSEFYDQDDCGAEAAEAAHLVIDYSPGPTGVVSATPPPRVQRPAVVVYSKGNKGVRTSVHPHQPGGSPFDLSGTVSSGSNGAVGGNEYYEEDPFKDRRDHLYQQHQQQRHSMHTSLGGGVGGHRSSGVSDYRRPHSYSAAGQRVGARGDTDVEPKTLNYRTHVLDESSDLESIADGEVAAVVAAGTGCQMQSNSSTIGKLSGNLLKDHFKRLSTPYVKAIRDQQQHQATSPTSLSCVEEGGGGRGRGEGNLQQKGAGGRDVDSSMAGGGNGFESSMPVPGPAPPSSSDRRWSRALLKGHRQQQSSSSEEVVEELSGDEVGTMQDHYRRGHRQVHSGSLASFRGLDDPSHPRLRVMNPDDGTS